jgi:RHS repeat-associated protein
MKIGIDNGGNWTAEYYEATVVSANDYYPFGSTMAGRKFSSGAYRYGFNGMEKDDEVKGEGNSYDFGARIFDSRVGRWLAVDPLAAKYPHLSPYNFTGNNPILYVDYDGRDFGVKIEYGEDGKTNIIIYQDIYVIDQTSYNQALEAAELWKKTTDLGDGWTVSTVVNVKEPKYNSENIKTSPDDKTLSDETVEIGKRRNKEIVPKYYIESKYS